jgi:hypothetical protein
VLLGKPPVCGSFTRRGWLGRGRILGAWLRRRAVRRASGS